MVDRGAMTPNEWRSILSLGPIEGGSKPIRRLDTALVKEEMSLMKEVMTMNKTEKRELLSSALEIRELENGLRTISGYAVKWEMKSVTMGYWQRFKEQFKKELSQSP